MLFGRSRQCLRHLEAEVSDACKTTPMTGFEANCLAAADHFIACSRSKSVTRIRGRFDRIDQAEAFAATFGDSRTMIYAVTA